MTFKFSSRSLKNLEDVHPDLVAVVTEALAISPVDFGIIEGVRTAKRQHDLFVKRDSQLDEPPQDGKPRGRHVTGHAVDFMAYVGGIGTWDVKYYPMIAGAMKIAATQLGIAIHWGGDNKDWKDSDHIELDRSAYPDAPELIA